MNSGTYLAYEQNAERVVGHEAETVTFIQRNFLPIASHVVLMLWLVLFVGSSIASIVANWNNAYILITLFISSASFTDPFRHSLKFI